MRKVCILLVHLLLTFDLSFVQAQNYYKKVPYLLSLNPSKLAYRLTHNLKTDSEKVCAIHAWITHKIKYDVKKWLKFDYSYQSPKKILRKRKTTCTGYSELFDILCKCAAIPSVTVLGYVKDINVNISNNFYLDEHSWNAVFINGEWLLLDPCWDAGYIKYTKRTFLGFFIYLISGGKSDIVKYKPHFVNYPTDTYFFKPPGYFKTDHLPLIPIWQLIAPPVSIGTFKADSGFYYKHYDTTFTKVNKYDQYEGERQDYLSADSSSRLAINAILGYKFNYRNHWEIGQYFYSIAEARMKAIDKKSRDTVQQLKACDTVIKYVDRAILHFDSNSYYLEQQKAELKHTNEQKRDTMSRQNKRLIDDTKEIIAHFLTSKSLSKSSVKKLKSLVKTNNRKFRMASKNISYYRKKSSKIYLPLDSLYHDLLVHALNDSIHIAEQKLQKTYSTLDSTYLADSIRINLYAITLNMLIQLEEVVNINRIYYYDDLDYEIRYPKDMLLNYKFKNDSLLYTYGEFRIIKLLHDFRSVKEDVDFLFSLYKLKISLLKDYKSVCVMSTLQDTEYQTNLGHWKGEINTITALKGKWINRFKQLKRYCAEYKNATRLELKGPILGWGGYFGERLLEYQFFAVRNNYINKHSNSLIMANKRLDERMQVLNKRMTAYKDNLLNK